jgi:pantoate--beta-alanine ligase
MQIIKKKAEIKLALNKERSKGKKIGFVPTMGYLHEGHISLIRQSKDNFDVTVVSIFVNPTQFGPSEDFNKYPRDFKRDSEIAQKEEVDYLFYPDVDEIYLSDHKSFVNVEKLDKVMCGKFRPNHFKGVCTIVLKLFNIINPDGAFFGKKDYQQFIIIKKMVDDLDIPVKIIGCETIREPDGLALSSRNKYLSKNERENATILYKTILFAEEKIKQGEKNLINLKKECIKKLSSNNYVKKIDYFDIRDPKNLKNITKINKNIKELLIASAIYLGSTRLIDNKVIQL